MIVFRDPPVGLLFRRCALFAVGLMTVACRDQRFPATEQTAAVNKSESIAQAAPVPFTGTDSRLIYYFGTTGDSEKRVARVLGLDTSRRGGRIYVPTAGAALCDVSVEAGQAVRWRAPLGDYALSFEGRLGDSVLSGRLSLLSTRGSVIRSDSLEMHRVAASGTHARYAGIYSDFEYHTESGDLAGNELVIIPIGYHAVGALSNSQGGAGAPIPLDRAEFVGDTLHFQVAALSGVEEHWVVFSDSGAKLGQRGSNGESLLKKGGLGEEFAAKSGQDCAVSNRR